MFTYTSRYYSLESLTFIAKDGQRHTYKRRRFLPDPADMKILAEVTVTQGDRLDIITAKSLGDPEQFWRVCDINNAMNPIKHTEVLGKKIKIPLPQFDGK